MYRLQEYVKWLDTKPKVFLSYREWMFTYYPDEDIDAWGIEFDKIKHKIEQWESD